MEQQLSSIPVVSGGKVVAFDWHQVTGTYRASRFKAFRADWDTAGLPQSVLDVYHQTALSCAQFDKFKAIILSHIEKSERNLEFLLRSTRDRLPVDLARSVLLDDNLQVCSEIKRVGGIPLNIKTQRREHWPGRAAWNIGDHLQFVEEWLSQ